MKMEKFTRILGLVCLMAALFGCKSLSDLGLPGMSQNFEGVLTYKLTLGQMGSSTQTKYLKGHLSRVDSEMNLFGKTRKTSIIMDGKAKTMTSIDHIGQSYTVTNFGQTPPPEVNPGNINAPNVEKTGDTETVAGVKCTYYKIGEVKTCIAEGLVDPTLSFLGNGKTTGLALKVVNTGTNQTIIETTNIEKKTVDDSTFAIPQGYKQGTEGGALGGLMGDVKLPEIAPSSASSGATAPPSTEYNSNTSTPLATGTSTGYSSGATASGSSSSLKCQQALNRIKGYDLKLQEYDIKIKEARYPSVRDMYIKMKPIYERSRSMAVENARSQGCM